MLRKVTWDEMELRVRANCSVDRLQDVHKLLPCLGCTDIVPTSAEQSVELLRQVQLAKSTNRGHCRCTLIIVSNQEFLGAALWPRRDERKIIADAERMVS